jgi:hypothetical protein
VQADYNELKTIARTAKARDHQSRLHLHQSRDILVEEYLYCSVLAQTPQNRSSAAIYLAGDCNACLLSRVCQLSVVRIQKRLAGEDDET